MHEAALFCAASRWKGKRAQRIVLEGAVSGDVNLSVIEYFVSVADLLAHKMHQMIALHVRGAVFAVLQNAFSELVDTLLPDLNKMAHISLKLAVSTILSPGTLEDAKTLWSLHVLLISRLQRRMADVGHLLTISIAGEDVPGYLADIREGYCGNHIGEFAIALGEYHGLDSAVLTPTIYDSSSIFQKLANTECDPRRRLVIPISDIEFVVGTSLRLKLQLSDYVLWFTGEGLSSRDDG